MIIFVQQKRWKGVCASVTSFFFFSYYITKCSFSNERRGNFIHDAVQSFSSVNFDGA